MPFAPGPYGCDGYLHLQEVPASEGSLEMQITSKSGFFNLKPKWTSTRKGEEMEEVKFECALYRFEGEMPEVVGFSR